MKKVSKSILQLQRSTLSGLGALAFMACTWACMPTQDQNYAEETKTIKVKVSEEDLPPSAEPEEKSVANLQLDSSEEPDINAFIFADVEPKPTNMLDIQKSIGYPQIAKDAGIQGNVVIRILVDEKGNYRKHRVINEVHPILTKAVTKHVDKLKFEPAIHEGKPIKYWVNVPFAFKLLN